MHKPHGGKNYFVCFCLLMYSKNATKTVPVTQVLNKYCQSMQWVSSCSQSLVPVSLRLGFKEQYMSSLITPQHNRLLSLMLNRRNNGVLRQFLLEIKPSVQVCNLVSSQKILKGNVLPRGNFYLTCSLENLISELGLYWTTFIPTALDFYI